MHPLHKLGNANTVTKFHKYYQTLTKNKAANNAYSTASYVPAKTKNRIGVLYNQKHAIWLS
jgi:hypothetical protein